MSKRERILKIIEYHGREAEAEFYRKIGEDPVYDEITWKNMRPFLPKGGWILDAGGGAGAWSIRMTEETKCMVVLLDVTRDLLKTAKRKTTNNPVSKRVEVLDADIRSLPSADMSFDFVLCEADPLSICGDPEKAAQELSRVLKPNGYLVLGVDSTLYRAFRMLSKGESLDSVLDFLQTGISPAEDEAPFDSKSFTPVEIITLLRKNGLETTKIVGKPIGFGPHMLDAFVAGLPAKRLHGIFEKAGERKKLSRLLSKIYDDPYIAGIGSHLQVVAVKKQEDAMLHDPN